MALPLALFQQIGEQNPSIFFIARFTVAARLQRASPLRGPSQPLLRKGSREEKRFTRLLGWRAQVTHVARRYWCVVQVSLTSRPDVGCSSTLGNASAARFSTVQ